MVTNNSNNKYWRYNCCGNISLLGISITIIHLLATEQKVDDEEDKVFLFLVSPLSFVLVTNLLMFVYSAVKLYFMHDRLGKKVTRQLKTVVCF